MFVLVAEGFDILARVQIGGESFTAALSETIHYSLVQPTATLFSFAPFAAIAWICGSLARVARARATGLMAACLILFALMYYGGHTDSQRYMHQRSWTAAALAVGLIPFKSIAVVLVALGLRFVLGRNRVPAKASLPSGKSHRCPVDLPSHISSSFPYGERQYTVADPAGHAWTFSQTEFSIDPSAWGGQLVG